MDGQDAWFRLVQTVHDNIDKTRNYAKLRKKLQGLDELHIYDMYVNLLPGIDKKYTFEEGWNLAMEFWRETFGDEYASVAERAREERWVDVYTNDQPTTTLGKLLRRATQQPLAGPPRRPARVRVRADLVDEIREAVEAK